MATTAQTKKNGPEIKLHGCTSCPSNGGHCTTKAPFSGLKEMPRVRVKCGVLNNQMVKPYKGEDHEECDRKDHVGRKRMSVKNIELKGGPKKKPKKSS